MTAVVDAVRCDAIAGALRRDEPALVSSLEFGPFVRQGLGPGPSIWIGDQVGIPLFAPDLVGRYDHRFAHLAQPGDIVVVRARDRAFEAYMQQQFGRRDVTFLDADAASRAPVAAQCRTTPALRAALVERLHDAGSLTIQPYVAHGHAWRLAADLGGEARRPVHVAGPSPRAMRRSNDKLWFWDLARRVAGASAVPPTWFAYGPAAAAGHVAHLIRHFDQVVLKIPASAGAAGNVRIEGTALRGRRTSAIRTFLMEQLAAIGWDGTYPVLVGVWESGVTGSPSAQLWIPKPEEGPPEVRGLFEQTVETEAGGFIGARPAHLDPALAARMSAEAIAIARVLQRVGYFGPCSLDAVLRTSHSGAAELHWVECNGRWSGVSIPLAVANRLQRENGAFVILQNTLPAARVSGVDGLVRALQGLLLKSSGREGVAILSPPMPGRDLAFNALVVAETEARADIIAGQALERLLRAA